MDQSSGLNLTSTNDVLQPVTDGVDSLARVYGSYWHYRASEAALQLGNVDCTWWAWCKLTSLGVTQIILAKDNNAAGGREYAMYLTAANNFRFIMFNGTSVVMSALNLGLAATTGVWYFVVGWYDAGAGQGGIDVNAGSVVTAGKTANPATTTTEFRIGNDARAGGGVNFNGAIQRVGFSRRVLTADERAWLFQGGRGRSYPFI